jgi:hypothetical protein
MFAVLLAIVASCASAAPSLFDARATDAFVAFSGAPNCDPGARVREEQSTLVLTPGVCQADTDGSSFMLGCGADNQFCKSARDDCPS